jgi:hypothetical protein
VNKSWNKFQVLPVRHVGSVLWKVHKPLKYMARETGLEPATSGVTGREKSKVLVS